MHAHVRRPGSVHRPHQSSSSGSTITSSSVRTNRLHQRCLSHPRVASRAWQWPFQLARPPADTKADVLLGALLAGQSSPAAISALVDQVIEAAAGTPFRPEAIGAGPWVVMHTRGPPALWDTGQRVGAVLASGRPRSRAANRAGQAFEPKARTVTNRAELAGSKLYITASGTYEPTGDSRTLPAGVRATIAGGCLHAWGREVPLPFIRGQGKFTVLYSGPTLRIFRSGPSCVVQVKEDALDKLLGE